MNNKKICTKCQKHKKRIEFALNKNNPNGLSSHCKKCKIIYAKKSTFNNKQKVKIYQKKYQLKYKKQIKKYMKIYYLKNKLKLTERAKTYYYKIKNRTIFKLKSKLYKKVYCIKNKIKIRNYKKLCLKNDIRFKIKENLRGRIIHAIRGNSKSLHTMFLIGCEVDYLMYYLQSQFKLGMNWDNYGLWHIDHIKPCASFDLSKEDEQRKCFHYTNLQPLWARDNLSKGDK